MRIIRTLAALAVYASTAAAQQSERFDSTRAQIHTTLRAFYFNLAHQDWEALTADILAAKVVAHRPAPDAMIRAAADHTLRLSPAADDGARCSKARRFSARCGLCQPRPVRGPGHPGKRPTSAAASP
jgi:hypothetical protein